MHGRGGIIGEYLITFAILTLSSRYSARYRNSTGTRQTTVPSLPPETCSTSWSPSLFRCQYTKYVTSHESSTDRQESLPDVIIPTLESLRTAITTFERQGGSVNVIVCDDGLQLISEAERKQRVEYYARNNIAYVARPPHGQDGFLRRGRFKKAGNMNHCNALSLKVEAMMDEMRAEQLEQDGRRIELWSQGDDTKVYDAALTKALEEAERKTWAGGNIRM
jgi:hypothetical protein